MVSPPYRLIPMRSGILAFFLGILVCQTLPYLPDHRLTYLLLPFLIFAWRWPRSRLLLFFAIGLLWMVWRADRILAQSLPKELEGQTLTVIGTIIKLPEKKAYGWQFQLAPTKLIFQNQMQLFSGHLRLSWYGSPPHPLRPGQQWQLTVRLKKPRGMLNEGTLDYSARLFRQQIRGLGYVYSKGEQRLLSSPSPRHLDNWRYQLAEAISKILGPHPNTPILIALAVGDDQGITQEQWKIFRNTGTSHLVAISGLHIGFITILSFWLAKHLWGFLGPAALWQPAPYFAAVVSSLATFAYALLAGFSIPTQRTFLMVTFTLFVTLGLARQMAFSHLFALALLVVLLWDPLAIMETGFWLSFGTVAIIIYASSNRPTLTNYQANSKIDFTLRIILQKISELWNANWIASLGLFPLTLAFFSTVSLSTFFANLIAIPLITLIIVPFTLLGTLLIMVWPPLANLCLQSANYFLHWLWPLLTWLGSPHWLWHSSPPLWVILTTLIGITILLLPRGFPSKWTLGLFWCLPLFFGRCPIPHQVNSGSPS